jgi:hypothetical protein
MKHAFVTFVGTIIFLSFVQISNGQDSTIQSGDYVTIRGTDGDPWWSVGRRGNRCTYCGKVTFKVGRLCKDTRHGS